MLSTLWCFYVLFLEYTCFARCVKWVGKKNRLCHPQKNVLRAQGSPLTPEWIIERKTGFHLALKGNLIDVVVHNSYASRSTNPDMSKIPSPNLTALQSGSRFASKTVSKSKSHVTKAFIDKSTLMCDTHIPFPFPSWSKCPILPRREHSSIEWQPTAKCNCLSQQINFHSNRTSTSSVESFCIQSTQSEIYRVGHPQPFPALIHLITHSLYAGVDWVHAHRLCKRRRGVSLFLSVHNFTAVALNLRPTLSSTHAS